MQIIKKILWGASVGAFSVLGFTASLPAYACGPAPQTPCPVLTSINVTPVNHTIPVGVSQQFTATGTFSNGTSRALTSGGGAWVAKAPLSTARHGAAVAALNNKLYAVGGTNGSSGSGTLATMEAYDPASNTWTPQASMSTARYAPALGEVNGQLYVVGGNDGLTDYNTMEVYDPATHTWTPKASMSTPRYLLAVGVVNGILYAVGGLSDTTVLATVEAYNPTTNTWSAKASLSTPRYALAVGVVNGTLYAVGGSDSNFNTLATVEAYDPATNTWSPRASLSTPRYAPAVGVVNGTLYAMGGSNNSGYLATMEAYDPAINTWTPKTSMPTARYGHATGVVNGTLYAVGGYNGSSYNPLATVEAYTPSDNTRWSSRTTRVATINQAGLAWGRGVGSTTITATSSNVSGATSLRVMGGQADIIVTAVSGSRTTIKRGQSFTVNSTTKNKGTAATTTATRTGLYLSTDAAITVADTRVGSVSIAPLAVGASQSASTRVIVPKHFARGIYYLGAIADYTGLQAESNEGNNSFTGTTIRVK